jgi:hypothetical protein
MFIDSVKGIPYTQHLFSFLFPFIILLLIVPLSDLACSLSPEGHRVIEKAQESLQKHQGQEPSGQPILVKLDTAYFMSHPKEGNNQVKVILNFTLTNNSLIDINANAVLKIYATNGTLLKTSSFPSGFILKLYYVATCWRSTIGLFIDCSSYGGRNLYCTELYGSVRHRSTTTV